MGLASEERYGEFFTRYVTHVSHWVKREKLLDPNTGKLRDPDETFMQDIERVLISQGERKEDFRKAVIGTIGARALDNPNVHPDYNDIFKVYIHRLREDFFATRRKILRKYNDNFMKYTGGEAQLLDAKESEQAKGMLEALTARHGYCRDCARDTVAYLLKKRYAED